MVPLLHLLTGPMGDLILSGLYAEEFYRLAAASTHARTLKYRAPFFESAVRLILPCIPLELPAQQTVIQSKAEHPSEATIGCSQSVVPLPTSAVELAQAPLFLRVDWASLYKCFGRKPLLSRLAHLKQALSNELCAAETADQIRAIGQKVTLLAAEHAYFTTRAQDLQQKQAGGISADSSGAHWCVATMHVVQLHGEHSGVRYARKSGYEEQWSVVGLMLHPTTLRLLHWSVECWSAGDCSVTEGHLFNAIISTNRQDVVSSQFRWSYPSAVKRSYGMLLLFNGVAGFEQLPSDESEQFEKEVRGFFEGSDPEFANSTIDWRPTVQAMKEVFIDALPQGKSSSARHTAAEFLGGPTQT